MAEAVTRGTRSRALGYARDDKSKGSAFLLSATSGRKIWSVRACRVAVRVPRVKVNVLSSVPAAVVIVALLSCGRAHAACAAIPNGASSSTIISIISACTSGTTANFAAGTYSLANTVNVPCGVSLAGPTIAPSTSGPAVYTPTAVINWSGSAPGVMFNFANACTTAASVKYLECNMNHPSPDGGQCLYVPQATSNFTYSYNYFHGDQANASGGNNFQDDLVLFDGSSSATPDANIVGSWNRFGATGDCSNVMSNITYGGFGGNGGFCSATGVHTGMNNFSFTNNDVFYQEEGLKVYSGQGECLNCIIDYNDFSNIHRIAFETQSELAASGSPATMVVQYNSTHDQFYPAAGTFGLSVANGCSTFGTPGCINDVDYNLVLNNVATAPGGSYNGLGIEFWGTGGHANYNLVQGQWSNEIMYAPTGQFTFNNNIFTSIYGNSTSKTVPGGPYGFFNNEDSPADVPSISGNTFPAATLTTPTLPASLTSVAPMISPASGSFTTSQTVTFTNPGSNRDTNTGIWYTTDGSTPVPGSGTAHYIASGGTIAVSTTTTVKAVGMWGAQNQPTSYPAGYGYAPSAVISATYTAGGGSVTLNSVTLSAAGPVTSIATGASVQMSAACHYNNGTTTSCNTTDAYGNSVSSWNTSNAAILTISGSGLATGVAVGSANLTATAAGVTSAPLALAVTTPSVTLSSVTLATTGGVTSIVAGSTNQLTATCHYSDGSTTTCTTTDSHGNAVATWNSSATTIATVSPGGLVTGVAAGSTNLSGVVAGITSSPLLTLSVTAAPPTLTGGYLGTPGSANTMIVGGTLQFSAYCQYSNSTTTNCSVADIYGNAVTQWLSSNTGEVTVGAVGSANPGLATAVAVGSPNIQAYVGGVRLNEWVLTISAPAVSLTGVSLATAGGVTGLFVGHTNQLAATCTYSDGSTTNCTTTDSHGNVAGSYSSSSSAHATVGASTGLVTGVAAGTTNLTAQAGSFTSAALPLTVLAIPSGAYVIILNGPVIFSGPVSF
jgi:hypothetical protein